MLNGPVVSVQDLEMLKTCMSLMLFTILAAESVNSATIMPEVDMENEKTQTMPQS